MIPGRFISTFCVPDKCFANRLQVNQTSTTHELFKAIIQNQSRPTFAVFHYMIPHSPFIFDGTGPKKLFAVYPKTFINYYGNLAYLDTKVGEIISILKKAGKYEDSLIIMTADHGWRDDPRYIDDTICWFAIKENYHVPLLIKMPYQKNSVQIDSAFNLLALGNLITKCLSGDCTATEVQSFLTEKGNDEAASLAVKTRQELLFSGETDIKTACKLKKR